MGERDAARVDVMAVLDVASRYDASADLVEAAVRTHLSRCCFDGAVAGRAHAASGDALHDAIGLLADQLRMWARASAETASALRVAVEGYAEGDTRGASRLG